MIALNRRDQERFSPAGVLAADEWQLAITTSVLFIRRRHSTCPLSSLSEVVSCASSAKIAFQTKINECEDILEVFSREKGAL
jgi:hypothetical protein